LTTGGKPAHLKFRDSYEERTVGANRYYYCRAYADAGVASAGLSFAALNLLKLYNKQMPPTEIYDDDDDNLLSATFLLFLL